MTEKMNALSGGVYSGMLGVDELRAHRERRGKGDRDYENEFHP